MLVARELRRLARILELDERLATLAQGRWDEATGLVAVTDRRIVFIGKQLVVEERILQAQRAMYSFEELKKVEGSQRRLSGTLELQLKRGRVQFTGVNPPERALEMAEIAQRHIAELRKTGASGAARSLAQAGAGAIADVARRPVQGRGLAQAGVEAIAEAAAAAATLPLTGHGHSGRDIAETA